MAQQQGYNPDDSNRSQKLENFKKMEESCFTIFVDNLPNSMCRIGFISCLDMKAVLLISICRGRRESRVHLRLLSLDIYGKATLGVLSEKWTDYRLEAINLLSMNHSIRDLVTMAHPREKLQGRTRNGGSWPGMKISRELEDLIEMLLQVLWTETRWREEQDERSSPWERNLKKWSVI